MHLIAFYVFIVAGAEPFTVKKVHKFQIYIMHYLEILVQVANPYASIYDVFNLLLKNSGVK